MGGCGGVAVANGTCSTTNIKKLYDLGPRETDRLTFGWMGVARACVYSRGERQCRQRLARIVVDKVRS